MAPRTRATTSAAVSIAPLKSSAQTTKKPAARAAATPIVTAPTKTLKRARAEVETDPDAVNTSGTKAKKAKATRTPPSIKEQPLSPPPMPVVELGSSDEDEFGDDPHAEVQLQEDVQVDTYHPLSP